MEESPHELLTEEQDKRDTAYCIFWPAVVVFGMMILLIYGMAFLSWTEPTMEEIYSRRMMDNSIKTMQNQIKDLDLRQRIIEAHAISIIADDNQEKIEYDTHKHHFWTGKVK